MRIVAFLLCVLFMLPAHAANNTVLNSLLAPKQQTFLPVNEAFQFDFDQQGTILFTGWDIAPGYYIYKHKLEIIAKNAEIKVPELEAGVEIEDEFFGKTEVYFNSLSIVSKLSNIGEDAVVKIRYQGCAEAGLCYPPEVITIPLSMLTKASDSQANSATQASTTSNAGSNSNDFVNKLAEQDFLTNLAVFFGVGVLLAFTPCVFPMFPILSSLIAGQSKLSTKKAFALSFVYVQGMAVTYAALGLVVAAVGGQIQGYLQSPAVLISFSLLFVLLAFAMFGWYEIKLPEKFMTRLTEVSNQQKGGNYLGVFFMGVLSGLIASPCTTAPLSAALLYVAQSGDYFVGGVTLYVLSLGMGLPLLLLGTSGGKLLPKAGAWMEQVKMLFGFVMLVVPLVLLERILEWNTILLLGSVWLIVTALFLHHWQSQEQSGKLKTTLWAAAVLFLIGGVLTAKHVLMPPAKITTVATASDGKFEQLPDLAALREAVALANQQGKIAMVDLYADWCVACKEFEKYTFSDDKVKQAFKDFSLLKLDLTVTNEVSKEIYQTFNVVGLPAILFFDAQGNELSNLRITGFQSAEEFTAHLEKVRQTVQ